MNKNVVVGAVVTAVVVGAAYYALRPSSPPPKPLGFGDMGSGGTGFGKEGVDTFNQPGQGGGSLPFVGPGNAVSGAIAWWGLRAYTTAKAGSKAANICNNGDANCADVNTLSNGNFDVATATAAPLSCGGAGGTCTIKTLYDQSGNTNCVGTACDITNATAAARPTLVLNCTGSLPCAACLIASSQRLLAAAAITQAQPMTTSMVSKRTAVAAGGMLGGVTAGDANLGYGAAASTVNLDAGGTAVTATASDNVFHTLQAVFNGASSSVLVDATTNASLTVGAQGLTGAPILCENPSGNFTTGNFAEGGVWAGSLTSPQQTALHANQCAYWGTTC